MASDDPFISYMNLPLADRRAIERLLSPSKRRVLQDSVGRWREAERREKDRARNPAALLGCSAPLSKHLLAVAACAPGTGVTEKVRSVIRDVIERRLAIP